MTITKQTIRVRINHWKNSRSIQILPDQVGLQVTIPSCHHCMTCQSRIREFTNTLAKKSNVIHQWKYGDDGAQWLFFPVSRGKDPLNILRKNLKIQIDWVGQ